MPGADRYPCSDERYPALAGPWVAVCGPSGDVDRVISLLDQREFPLPVAHASPALADSVIYVPGMAGGTWTLTEAGPLAVDEPGRVARVPAAPPTTDGDHFALLGDVALEVWTSGERSHKTWTTIARGWQAPALAWPWVAWVADGPAGGQVWAIDVRQTNPAPLSAPTADARHPAGAGSRLWWVEDGVLVAWDSTTQARQVVDAGPTGFSAPLSAWGEVVCWEERGRDGVDARCSDGLTASGPGDQRWPSRYDRWLLFREDGRTRLAELPLPEVP